MGMTHKFQALVFTPRSLDALRLIGIDADPGPHAVIKIERDGQDKFGES